MKQIIDGKLYNTRDAKRICTYYQCYTRGGILTQLVKWSNKCVLHKTKQGAYFIVEHDNPKKLKVISKDEAREIMMKICPDKYIRLFGSIEEA